MESRMPRRWSGTFSGSKPWPRSRTKTSTPLSPTSAKTEMVDAPDDFAALTMPSRAAATVADNDDIDRDGVAVLDVGRGGTQRGREGHGGRVVAGVGIEPIAKLALLPAGEPSYGVGVARLRLQQRQRLQDGVVHVRGDLGAFLLTDAFASFRRELAEQPEQPRPS